MPPKCRARKPRRPHKPTPAYVDKELAELTMVLAECKLDNEAENWLKLPWRDGWNAVKMAYVVSGFTEPVDGCAWLHSVCRTRATGQDVYWAAQDRLSSTETPNKMMRAAYRCLQVLLANSDGGGEVYNGILMEPFLSLSTLRLGANIDLIAEVVREHRCLDSIGVTPTMKGDANDRLRRAFMIAWERGLYQAAYSLPTAVLPKLKRIK
jgi:hypothetical protein